jgi:hypothetical protein
MKYEQTIETTSISKYLGGGFRELLLEITSM